MESFPFKPVIIALIVIIVIVAGVGLYLGADDSPPLTTTTTTTTTPSTTTTPTTTIPTTTTSTTTTPPQMTPEEQTYALTITSHASIIGQALAAIGELMANLQIDNSEWIANVLVQLAIIQAVYNEAPELDPPNSMADINDKYVQSMNHYETATHLVTQGIEKLDADLLEQAITEINTGNQLLTEAIELLNEFTQAHSP